MHGAGQLITINVMKTDPRRAVNGPAGFHRPSSLVYPDKRERRAKHDRNLESIGVHDTRVGLQTTWDAWSPWYVVAEADEELDRKAIFASHYLWANPQTFFPIGSKVTVYRHPEKPAKYAFQFEELPETL
jgi:hypothetical protein